MQTKYADNRYAPYAKDNIQGVSVHNRAHMYNFKIKGDFKMFGDLFGRCCGGEQRCGKECRTTSSCEVMWIIILLLIVFKGGLFGIDICTLVILFIVFGKDLLCCVKKPEPKCC